MTHLKNQERIETILEIICERYNVTYEELQQKKKDLKLVTPRMIAMSLIYSFTYNTKTSVASIFNRDHCTLIHGMKKVLNYYEVEKSYRDKVNMIIDEINFKCETRFSFENVKDAESGFRASEKLDHQYYAEFVNKARQLMEVDNRDLIMIIVNEMKQLYKRI